MISLRTFKKKANEFINTSDFYKAEDVTGLITRSDLLFGNNKFGNPDIAKALSWVVDKKDARIIISNEIDGDEDTVLNGAFIKTLASGGDALEGRRLYENVVSFIPQFTMILCYNHFYDIKPADAKENLEQFEYKSKFVSEV